MNEKDLRRMYIDEKRSAREIAERFHCSVHKVNYWFERYQIQKRSISEAIYTKRNPKGDPFEIKDIKTVEDAKLFGLGIGLYWGEGNKRNDNAIRLGSVTPGIIRNFMEFLVVLMGVQKSKFRFGLQIFSDMSREKCLQFWLRELKEFEIKPTQFFKVTVAPTRGAGSYREKSKFGVLTV